MRAPNPNPVENPIERYQSLRLKDYLSRSYHYPFACKELSLFLRSAYSTCPKNLQTQIFQDTLFAFNLLPEIQIQSAISAANSLLQSAEYALPKQKRGLAVKEYKHAMVACKRKSKSQKEGVLTVLPQDVLVYIFGFLDLQSLVSAASVCRFWNAVASDNHLWKSLHATFFDHDETKVGADWRYAFKRAYREVCSKKLKSHRGYCYSCGSIVWLNINKCSNNFDIVDISTHHIKPLSPRQVVEYILGDSFSSESSSDDDDDDDDDDDSDTEDDSICKLWAYYFPKPQIAFGTS